MIVRAFAIATLLTLGASVAFAQPSSEDEERGSAGATRHLLAAMGLAPPPKPVTVLSRGDKGDDVVELQQAMRRHGIPLRPDGHFGAGTESALRSFQRKQGLEQTGQADAATWAALNGLVPGDRGGPVADLQRLINHQRRSLGQEELKVDANYGPGTKTAVEELQRSLNREVTGRADEGLIEALQKAQERDTRPVLRPGDQGKHVERLQERLNAHREAAGLAKIHETGHFNERTATALETFQRGYQIDESGESDNATWAELEKQPPTNVRARPMREGDNNDEVALFQDRLNSYRRFRGKSPLTIDGDFGPGTRRAVEEFQRENDLPVTGRVDVDTVAALEEATKTTFDGTYPIRAQYPAFSNEAKQLFAAAARLIGVPESWAYSNGLHQILFKESKGWVGIPNYSYGRRKTDHSAWASVHEELRRGRIRARSSATGLGQLLLSNVDKYYPQGRAGIGDPLNEAAGMLAYIRDRYRTPARAWALYGKRHEGY
ncbi:MAG TPA: hypothetical protein DEA08_26520 [Planctomycetes bacterium]|nr:hypothetical protein [Planctomycetota bacterium]|tara:strand:- start:70 stop:1542 length:1473 start_codon:yes stop_codon:yes gene_type:complete